MTPNKTLEATALVQEHRQLLKLIRTMQDVIDQMCIAFRELRPVMAATSRAKVDQLLSDNEASHASIMRLLEMPLPPDVSPTPEWDRIAP